MQILHASWTRRCLYLWGESRAAFLAGRSTGSTPSNAADRDGGAAVAVAPVAVADHPFASAPSELKGALLGLGLEASVAASISDAPGDTIVLQLPEDGHGPSPSDRLAVSCAIDRTNGLHLGSRAIPALRIDAAAALPLLLDLDPRRSCGEIEIGQSTRFWGAVARELADLLCGQRFIPTVVQDQAGEVTAQWEPWVHDEASGARLGRLLTAMPPVTRAVVDEHEGRPWPILQQAMQSMVDAAVRRALIADDFADALDGKDAEADSHVAWLTGLLGAARGISLPPARCTDLIRDVGRWVGRLDDGVQAQPMRLLLRLCEPIDSELLREMDQPGDDVRWRLVLALRDPSDPDVVVEADQIWGQVTTSVPRAGRGATRSEELLLTELTRAGRIYPHLETALAETTPVAMELTTDEAYAFLSEYAPLLEESGVFVEVPGWWNAPTSRLGARLHIEPGQNQSTGVSDDRVAGQLGLDSLVSYRWQVAVGDQPLTEEEFAQLIRQGSPLMRIRGQWVQLPAEQLKAAQRFLQDRPGGDMTLLEAIQLAHGVRGEDPGLPVFGLDATGWVSDLLEATGDHARMPETPQPKGFLGTLRPYQKTGLSWLAFLDRFGLGACLADDMGLGKTIQLIALLLHEREREPDRHFGPTFLIVPTSLIGNWTREVERFGPTLTYHVHHGADRLTGEAFARKAAEADIVISTYGLVSRDRESLLPISWHRVVLDEAQYIKNPPTKQTTIIRSLNTCRRVTLTGTPVENRLSELWSIMEFCNPGYLSTSGEFRRRFAIPIERRRDAHRAEVLRDLVRPFVLRRLKVDPEVIDDLPPCVQTREYANLTPVQARLYQDTVNAMLDQVGRSDGIQRRGLVLSTLVKLKQICDHPDLLRDKDEPRDAATGDLVALSGKSARITQMLEQVCATNERALIFTQFRRMGHLLTAMLQHELDEDVLFLHGGTTPAKRQALIDRFQDPASDARIFVLSLKAGGVGLNLTAATHVFHYDRWWNPAVENQATDRAFRIGQTRTVHVHKFVCLGTLEERIDQMIEQKTELAEQIIGSGEQWLTELSTGQLRDLLTLRRDATDVLETRS